MRQRNTERFGTTPILFLDVDGVISLFGFAQEQAPPGAFHWVNGVLHYISEGCGRRLLRLREQYELVWATGWEETANEYLPHLLELPGELPVVSFDATPQWGTAHWKLTAIDRYAGPRPLAWIDDCHDESCRAWAEERDPPTLLIQSDPAMGLCDPHVDELMEWAAALSGAQ